MNTSSEQPGKQKEEKNPRVDNSLDNITRSDDSKIPDTRTPTVENLSRLQSSFWKSHKSPRIPLLLVLYGEQKVRRHIIDQRESVIGRNPKSDIFLDDEKISRRHAQVIWENNLNHHEYPICRIEDLGSRNGIYINRQKVDIEYLSDGDRILMGSTIMGFFIKDRLEVDYENNLLSEATIDHLTMVATRRSFEISALQNLYLFQRYDTPFCFAILDIDNFTFINDDYGHATGDIILNYVAGLLLSSLRKSDVIGRIGGDEFGIILPRTKISQGRLVIEKLIKFISSSSFKNREIEIPVSLSAGLLEINESHSDWKDIYQNADLLLYKARDKGPNQLFSSE